MKTTKHPLLDLEINEDGTVIIYQGKELPILSYKTPRDNYTWKRVNFMGRTHTVGKLVCEAWNGMRESLDQQLCRKDFNPENDHYTNLYWSKRGTLHTARRKRDAKSKIKNTEIPEVIKRIEGGETLNNIAKSYNTSDMSIHRIKKRFMQDQIMMLKDKIRHSHSTHERKQAYAKHLGYGSVGEAIGTLGKDVFFRKADDLIVTL